MATEEKIHQLECQREDLQVKRLHVEKELHTLEMQTGLSRNQKMLEKDQTRAEAKLNLLKEKEAEIQQQIEELLHPPAEPETVNKTENSVDNS